MGIREGFARKQGIQGFPHILSGHPARVATIIEAPGIANGTARIQKKSLWRHPRLQPVGQRQMWIFEHGEG